MKKKMKKISLFILLLASVVACDIDRLPNDNLIADTAYMNVDDLQSGLNGVYGNYNYYNIILFNSQFTDEVKIGADNGGQGVAFHNQNLTSVSAEANAIFNSHYRTINLANRILEAAESIVPAEGEEAQYDNILGQMYAIRALCHFDLLNHYTEDPTDLASLGVPYADMVVRFTDLPRNTVEEVRDKILEDLTTAESYIASSDNAYMNANSINFLRAKTLFLTGDYAGALPIADDLIATVPLATVAEYPSIFDDTSEAEVIFKKNVTASEAPRVGGIWYFTGTGGAFFELSNSIYGDLDPLDVRYNVIVDVVNSDPTNDLLLINKYPGSAGVQYNNDYKVMRISEMYFIKAECHTRLNQFTDAAAAVKAVRDARFGTATVQDVYANQQQAAVAILDERKIELAFEGHRYVDIKRLRDISNIGIVRNALDCGGATPCTLGVTDFRFTLPIPQAELDSNAAIRGQQNTGY